MPLAAAAVTKTEVSFDGNAMQPAEACSQAKAAAARQQTDLCPEGKANAKTDNHGSEGSCS